MNIKKCLICGKVIISKPKRQIYCSNKCKYIGNGTKRKIFNKTSKGKLIEKNRGKKISIGINKFNKTLKGIKNKKMRGYKISIIKKEFYKSEEGQKLKIKQGKLHKKRIKDFYKSKKGYKMKKHLSEIGVKNAHKNLSKQSKKKWELIYKKRLYQFRSKMELVVAKYLIDNKIKFIYETDINIFFIKKLNCYY